MSNQYCSWRDGRAAFFGGWVQFKDEWRYLVACGEHVGYLGGPEKTDRLPYRSPEPRARRGQQRGICHVNMSPEMAARLLAAGVLDEVEANTARFLAKKLRSRAPTPGETT